MTAPDKLNISWIEGADDGRVEYTTAGRFLDTGVDYIRADLVTQQIAAAEAAAYERAAQVCEEWGAWNETAQAIAAAIRARGEV